MDPSVVIAAQQLSAATGVTGAGTHFGSTPRARAWGELGFTSQEDDGTPLWLLAGAGVRLGAALELEAILPMAYWGLDDSDVLIADTARSSGGSSQGAWIGNPYLGANLLLALDPALRIRLGAGVALPVVGNDAAGCRCCSRPRSAAVSLSESRAG